MADESALQMSAGLHVVPTGRAGSFRGLSLPTIKMIPSYLTRLPTGSESGEYLAVDLGGSVFRTMRVVLKGGLKYRYVYRHLPYVDMSHVYRRSHRPVGTETPPRT